MLGIRVPHLRKLAARIAKSDWETYLDTADTYYMEERMLHGMVLGCIRPDADIEVYLHRVTRFVWNINSWSEIRFGVVMAMQLFIDEEHIGELLSLYNAICHEGYYVRMGVAWALSVCFVKFPQQTMAYLQQNSLDNFTYNKALQKIVESYRVDAATKDVIRGMKR